MSRRAPVGKTGIAYRMNILLTANGAPGEITLALAAEYLTGARVLRAYDRARARARGCDPSVPGDSFKIPFSARI